MKIFFGHYFTIQITVRSEDNVTKICQNSIFKSAFLISKTSHCLYIRYIPILNSVLKLDFHKVHWSPCHALTSSFTNISYTLDDQRATKGCFYDINRNILGQWTKRSSINNVTFFSFFDPFHAMSSLFRLCAATAAS